MTDWIGLKEAAEIVGIKRRGMLKRITDGLVPEQHMKREEHPVYGVTWYVTREYAEQNPYIAQAKRPRNRKESVKD